MAIDPIHPNNQVPRHPQEQASPFQTLGSPNAEESAKFGPDYVLDKSLQTNEIAMGVPFAPVTAAQTLAALPPIHPIGAASLTELSLQKMMQPRHKVK